jgi:redox-sensitive bicupin YhaK (pirin superfamily)
MGTGTVIVPGDVQRMSAGTGVRHSEFNHAEGRTTHFLQIWLLPDRTGIAPGYEQKHFTEADKRGHLKLVASQDGREGSLTLHANAALSAGLFDGDEQAEVALPAGRLAYLHVVRGSIEANGQALSAGDALALSGEPTLTLREGRQAEVLLFDLAR